LFITAAAKVMRSGRRARYFTKLLTDFDINFLDVEVVEHGQHD